MDVAVDQSGEDTVRTQQKATAAGFLVALTNTHMQERFDEPFTITGSGVIVVCGGSVEEVCLQIGVTKQTYSRWRKEYGGPKMDQAKRL